MNVDQVRFHDIAKRLRLAADYKLEGAALKTLLREAADALSETMTLVPSPIPNDEHMGLIDMSLRASADLKQDINYHWANTSLELRTAWGRVAYYQAGRVENGAHVNGTHMAIGAARSLGDVLFDVQALTTVPAVRLVEATVERVREIQAEIDTGRAVIRNNRLERLDKKLTAH